MKIIGWILLTMSGATWSATPPLVLGAPPLQSATQAHRLYDPLARYLSSALGRPDVHGPHAVMQAVRHDLCAAGVVPAGLTLHVGLRVLTRERFPGQAFSVTPRLGHKFAGQLGAALLATSATSALRPLVQTYSMGGLRAASGHEYVGSEGLLKSTWGFYPTSLLR